MDTKSLKESSFQTGKTIAEFAKQNHLAEKSKDFKTQAMEKYEQETGRNASTDGSILKFSAVATAGAVAISAAPAIFLAGAVGATVVAAASTKYSLVTGRDGKADRNAVVAGVTTISNTTVEMAKSFQEGYKSVKEPPSSAPTSAVSTSFKG